MTIIAPATYYLVSYCVVPATTQILQNDTCASLGLSSPKMYNLKCRVKSEMYMDEAKLKVSAIGISAVDWVSEGRTLLQEIGQLKGGF